MSLVTPDQVKAQVDTDLEGSVIQEVIDREEAEIDRRFGSPLDGLTSETLRLRGRSHDVFVPRPINTVTSLKEADDIAGLATAVALTVDEDYYIWSTEGRIERMGSTTWGQSGEARFGSWVEVVYEPIDDREERKRTIIELCRLTIHNTPFIQESVGGEYSYTRRDYEKERDRLMSKIAHFVVV